MTSGYECFAEGFFHMSLSYAWCFYQYTCTIMSIVAGLQLTNSYLRKASLTPAVFSRLTFGYMGIGTRGGGGHRGQYMQEVRNHLFISPSP